MKAIYQIVGMKFRDAVQFTKSLPDGEALKLIREVGNAHDRYAVQVWARDKWIGYVSGKESRKIAEVMDRQKLQTFTGKLVNNSLWPHVQTEE